MVFEIPKSKASIDQNRFKFKFPGERKTYSVPLMKYLKPSLAVQFEELSEVAAFKLIIDEYIPEAFEKFDDVEQFEAFLEQWKSESGISVGESEASPSS